MRLDDRTGNRQTHPHTAGLRGVEGIEEVLHARRREAWTRVPHLDEHSVRFGFLAADEQLSRSLARAGHRLDCVDDQVEDHLLELDPICLDERQALCELRRTATRLSVVSPRVSPITSRIASLTSRFSLRGGVFRMRPRIRS